MKGTRLGTPEQQIAALEKNIEIMEANEKVTAQTQYANGREDEREAILHFLRFGCADSPERKKWVSWIDEKKHLKPKNSAKDSGCKHGPLEVCSKCDLI